MAAPAPNNAAALAPTDVAAFRDVIGYHLRIAQEVSFQAIRQGAGGMELKPGWYTVLTVVRDSPGLTPSELSLICGRDRSTLAGMLKELAARRLISRRRSRSDGRSYQVQLTARGATMLEGLRRHSERHDARLDAIAGADKPLLIAVLRRIATELKQETEETLP